ncbi:L,D-transpeptidase family protein [Nakamurella flavida]|uniref:L,D-transpeptidase family protein n=1 Tax=Nakamurella flavida TaxID=363630 RepID=A0A938YR77_9ACTN|nr:Ig-like domain-containing protein [Nakamurella flavida]MBM9477957.1 L,D-transpeptidase family protein [Nakamurella flavida]MDP9778327.1 lipoprotein-anchoring transpeptidase ErfK/SrfK [Nakamurella flavida]
MFRSTPARRRPAGGRPRWAAVAAVAAAGLMALTACSSSNEVVVTVTAQATSSGVTAPGLGASSAPATSSAGDLATKVRVSALPAFGSTDLPPNDPITITVFSAKIGELTVKADDGVEVKGEIAEDGATWTLTDRLAYNTTYTFAGTAVAADGATTPIQGQMSTVNPTETMRAAFNIPTGTTVGVAAPLIITFAGQVTDKAAAQATLHVTTDKGDIEGSWGWLQDEDIQGNGTLQSIVHFRPKEYWPAYTNVHFEADLNGVDYGTAWGREDISSDFTIGRAQIVEADVNTFRMVVKVDGAVVKNYPVSYGKESVPGRATVSGIHVVTEKFPVFSMCNQQFDYCGVDEKWAVRINNNGEFIHENLKSVEFQGKANVSHGCVNMGPGDAEDYYNSALYGDPVEVSNTGTPMTNADAIYDWSYSWDEWKALSKI